MKLCLKSIKWKHINEKRNFIFGDFHKKQIYLCTKVRGKTQNVIQMMKILFKNFH